MNCSCGARLRSDNRSGLCKTCYRSAYKLANRLHSREKQRIYRECDLPRWLLQTARKRAKAKGIEFTITTEDIFVPEYCPYLGIDLYLGTREDQDHSPSLDRIDPELGYVPGNVQVISTKANRMKSSASHLEVLTFAQNALKIHGELMAIDLINYVGCPRCGEDGPHGRDAAALDGSFVLAHCYNCDLKWPIAGPEKWVSE